VRKWKTLAQHEYDYILRVLRAHAGSISETARALGLHRRTLQRKLRKDREAVRRWRRS